MPNILDLKDMHIHALRGSTGDLIVVCDVNYTELEKQGKASDGWVHFYGIVAPEKADEFLESLKKIPQPTTFEKKT